MSGDVSHDNNSQLPTVAEGGAAGILEAETSAEPSQPSPPPQSPETIRTRSWIIFSYWAIVIFLGLPIWWKTTTIYRADLPLKEMNSWADGKACHPVFPLQIAIEAQSLLPQDAEHLIRTTQHALDDLNEFSAHHLRLRASRGGSNSNGTIIYGDRGISYNGGPAESHGDVVLSVRLLSSNAGNTPFAELQPYAPIMDVYYAPHQIPSTSSSSSPLANFIADQLQEIFSEEQAIIAYILSTSNFGITNPSSSLSSTQMAQSAVSSVSGGREHRSQVPKFSAEFTEALARRTTRALKYSPTYHLTFSLFTPGASPSSWDIEEALNEFLSPILSSISPISNFTVDTQVQLFASFSPSVRSPQHSPDANVWTLRSADLSGFINAAEWPLSPSIGAGPSVNFILYVPDPSNTPLVVEGSHSTSWLIPQWGAVAILNPSENSPFPSHLSKEALRPAFATFSHQLLSLLGLPSSPADSLPLRLLSLTRIRSLSLILSASSTLGSLARLTLALPSISIPPSVAHAVSSTITNLNLACADLREGRFEAALTHAREAEAEAERGFFEKSMVGQVYFPDEHKVAVYLPLLGPVGVPLVVGLIREAKRLIKERKKRSGS